MTTFILGAIFFLTLVVGIMAGWIIQAMFTAHINFTRHDYEDLFEQNPHPELFDDRGEIYRGEYMNVKFDPDYDPEEFDPDDVTLD